MDRRTFIKDTVITGATLAGAAASVGFFEHVESSSVAVGGSPRGLPLRPPGALVEEDYLQRCTRCMRCVDACPNQALLPLDASFGRHLAGTPALKPRRQACMLCAKIDGDYLKCGEACPTGAIVKIRKDEATVLSEVRIGLARIDHDLCYSYNNWSCGACIRACPFEGKAMTAGLWERPEVHEEFCTGCGLCERACIRYPQAIRIVAGAARPGSNPTSSSMGDSG